MTATIEALYIFDDQRNCILEHIYTSRPPRPADLLRSYFSHPSPQSSVLYLRDLRPPTTIYSLCHSSLLFVATSTPDTQSLLILEFLRRVVDIFEDFLGSPLLPNKIEENYEIVAQLLAEICDGGTVCNTEPNALKEQVEVSSRLGKLFEQVGIPTSTASLGNQQSSISSIRPNPILNQGPSIPWRRPNVRYTSNELYVDILETLHVILSPSGRPLSARSHGSIAMTAKISGVPDISLLLSAPGGTSAQASAGITRTMALPTFHPCVRLNRWKEKPGELSFVPPDGRFMLAGYEVDLLPYSLAESDSQLPSRGADKFFLPATVDLLANLGEKGNEFEARLTLNNSFPGTSTLKQSSSVANRSGLAGARGGATGVSSGNPFTFGAQAGSSGAPVLEGIVVHIPFSGDVKSVLDLRPSRGDAQYDARENCVVWKIPTKDAGSVNGTATLKGSVVGSFVDADENDNDATNNTDSEYYGDQDLLQAGKQSPSMNLIGGKGSNKYKILMPRSISTSFTVKGWLPSGIKVEALQIDPKRSKGLGDGVRPYKGVKYLTVSRKGIEKRVA